MNIIFAEPIGLTEEDKSLFHSDMHALGHNVVFHTDTPSGQEELLSRIKDAEVVVISNYPIEKGTIVGANRLKFINVAFTGTDHIDKAACKQLEIQVSNAAGYSTQAVAELTMGMAIDLLRKITFADSVTRSLGGRSGFLGNELNGKTFGILGAGAIGQRVAELAKAFGCRVVAWSRTKQPLDGVLFLEFDEVVRQSDILSLHLPLTSQTENLVGMREFKMMKPTSVLINTARAKVVNTSALVDALNEGYVAGAAVDIYENEPPLEANHPLLSAPNTIMLPHIAFATHEAIALRSSIVIKNIKQWLMGKPQNLVE